MLIYAALSGSHVTHAEMLLRAALSDGYGGNACCDGYSLEFLNGDGCRNLLCRTGWAWGGLSVPGGVREGAVRAVC